MLDHCTKDPEGNGHSPEQPLLNCNKFILSHDESFLWDSSARLGTCLGYITLSTKGLRALLGDQCQIGLHLARSSPPSSPNAVTPRYSRTSRRPLMFVCVPLSQRTLYFRGRVRTSPFVANLTLLGDLGGKSVTNCRRSRLACPLVSYGNITLKYRRGSAQLSDLPTPRS